MPKVHFYNDSPPKPIMKRVPEPRDYKEYQDIPPSNDSRMLRVVPNESLSFSKVAGAETVVEITSNCKIPVSFKVQTTSPEKFRVRPRCGFIMPCETIPIGIMLKPDQQVSQSQKDKFLIMSVHVPASFDMNSQEPFELWMEKNINTPGVEQYRLICVQEEGSCLPDASVASKKSNGCVRSCDDNCRASDCPSKLEKRIITTQILQWITLIFIMLMFAFLWMTSPNPPSFSSAYKKYKCRHPEL